MIHVIVDFGQIIHCPHQLYLAPAIGDGDGTHTAVALPKPPEKGATVGEFDVRWGVLFKGTQNTIRKIDVLRIFCAIRFAYGLNIGITDESGNLRVGKVDLESCIERNEFLVTRLHHPHDADGIVAAGIALLEILPLALDNASLFRAAGRGIAQGAPKKSGIIHVFLQEWRLGVTLDMANYCLRATG